MSGVQTFTQSLSRRRASSWLTNATSTPGQDAAGDGTRQPAKSWQREIQKRIKAAGMVMGNMPKCSSKSTCGKLVGVVHGDDILLARPRSRVGAVRKCPRKRYETREQMMGTTPTDASEIVMLNRRVQWTERIRISPDPRDEGNHRGSGSGRSQPADTPNDCESVGQNAQ